MGADPGTNSTTRLRMSGGGTLLVTNAGQNFTVGFSVAAANAHGNSATLDLSKLGSVTLGAGSSPLGELRVGYGKGSGSTSHTLTLSDTNNAIAADTVQLGNSTGYNGSSGTLILGAGSNLIAADTINIGLSKVSGTVKFASQAAGSPGAVVIRGRTGPGDREGGTRRVVLTLAERDDHIEPVDRTALEESVKAYRAARDEWAKLANLGKVYVADITVGENPVLRGHWLDRLTAIDERLKKLEKGFEETEKKAAAKEEMRSPEALYQQGLSNLKGGNPQQARELFTRFITAFPKHELTANALYWVGETYYSEKKYDQAILEFQEVIKNFPGKEKVPAAMLKQGMAFKELGDVKSARYLYKKLLEDFPASDEARVAKEKLKAL